MSSSESDAIRQFARETYVRPALSRRDRRFAINVGQVHRAVGLRNRVPQVCAALSSKKFLVENGLLLVSRTGPPSGQSTTVTFTYELAAPESRNEGVAGLRQLRGLAKDIFRELGGGETFIRSERSRLED